MRTLVTILAVVLLTTADAAAQGPDRGYVQGMGGVASGSATDQFFGGAAALRALGPADAFVEIGRLRNGIWSALDDELSAAGETIRSEIERVFGSAADVRFEARVPVTYGVAGARFRGPALGALRPYLEGGIGLARLRPEVGLTVDGEALDDEAARLLTLDQERTELMSAAGAGVALTVLGRVRVEAGYRFSRVHGEFAFNSSRVHVGLGYAF